MADKPGVIIAIDKPPQWTSFQVVGRLKAHLRHTFGLKKFKIGHAGTLDPLATGLLLVCVGSATKQIEALQQGVKRYSGTMVLGATTPCFDLEQPVDAYYPFQHITPTLLDEVRPRFVGQQQQVPPSFSAVKVDGQRAYAVAREGDTPLIAAKSITIYDLQFTAFRAGDATFQPPAAIVEVPQQLRQLYRAPLGSIPDGLPQVDFSVTCSKGTYIRSMARDIGAALGSGAFLGALRRERIGDYTLTDALSIDQIDTLITPDNPRFQPLTNL